MKASTALNDVYAIGLCIAEKDIITGLSAEIMKQQTPPNSMHQDVHFQNVIDSNSKQILEKLNTITNMMKTVVQENKDLKGHIVNLEKKSRLPPCYRMPAKLASTNPPNSDSLNAQITITPTSTTTTNKSATKYKSNKNSAPYEDDN